MSKESKKEEEVVETRRYVPVDNRVLDLLTGEFVDGPFALEEDALARADKYNKRESI